MTTSEKVSYLKGLADGLAVDSQTNEGKMFAAVIDALEAVARDIKALEENDLYLGEEIDALSDDLADVEDVIFDDEDEDEDGDCCRCCEDGDLSELYEITCPTCGEVITVDRDIFDLGETECPNCGEELEFDPDGEDE